MNPRVLAAIALVAGLPQLWRSFSDLRASLPQSSGVQYWSLFVFGVAVTVLMPAFDGLLIVHERPWHFPRRMRTLAWIGMLGFGGFIALTLVSYLGDLLGYLPAVQRIFGPFRVNPYPLPVVQFVLNFCSNGAQFLLMVVFYHATDDEQPEGVSQLLARTATITAIAFGLVSAFNIFRQLATPHPYVLLRDMALSQGARPFTFAQVLWNLIPALLGGIGLFVAPYMIWRSRAASETRALASTETIITPACN